MLRAQELIDITLDLESRRRRFRRRLIRVVVPIGSVILILAAIVAIAFFAYRSNRRDTLALTEDLLNALEHRIATEVRNYLSPAADMVRFGADIFKLQSSDYRRRALEEPLAIEVLKNKPQLTKYYFGDPGGNFLMQARMSDGSIHTKIIDRKDAVKEVKWIRRDPDGNIINIEVSADDTYDPRDRPWYVGAVANRRLYWTEVYIFFTDQKPGITASMPAFGQDGELLGVVGVDIELENLSAFLRRLEIGQNGRAVIIDERQRLVAYPDLDRMFKREGETLQPLKLDQLDDGVMTRVFSRFRIEGHGHRDLTVDGKRYVSMASSLRQTVGRDWSVLIVVPEDDFVGFVRENVNTSLLMAAGVFVIASLLAGLLVLQGLRADRNARLLLEHRQELEAQRKVFSELAAKAALFDPKDVDALRELTEIVSETASVRRTSVWRLADDGRHLVCDDCFDHESKGHTQGTLLARRDLPRLFEVLGGREEILVTDADSDKRTAELHRLYLHPLGCRSLLSVPIIFRGQTAGAVWFEHEGKPRVWKTEEITFARLIAGMLALRLSAAHRSAEPGSAEAIESEIQVESAADAQVATETIATPKSDTNSARQSVTSRQTTRSVSVAGDLSDIFYGRLAARGIDRDKIGADVFPVANVLVLRFTDYLSLAERLSADKKTTAVDHLVCHLEELATAHGIDYMKIVNDQIICAAGLNGDSHAHARVIADLAIDIQEQCSRVFAGLDMRMNFCIGIDRGAAIGGLVGRERKSYNLWGEAVLNASKMADSGVPGGIHVTESTYRCLQTGYLFRVRGTYYMENFGEISTYLLTGRI